MASTKVTVTVRLDPETRERVAAYMAATGCAHESTAIRELVETGLVTTGSGLLTSPLARFVREVMEGQLGLLRAELDERCDELEDRVARVCSRGAKAAIHSAALVGDLARASVPAYQRMSAEELWAVYEALGGAVQQGLPFADARRQAREAGRDG